MEFGNENFMLKKPKFEISAESVDFIFVIFSIPEEIAIYVTERKISKVSNFSKFSNFFLCKKEFENEKGMPKRLNAKF